MVSDKRILNHRQLLNLDKKHAESSTALVCKLDETLFEQFIVKNPIWDFNSISKDEYLYINKEQKEQLILNYKSMKKDERYIFYFVVCLINCLFILVDCFFPNFSSNLKPYKWLWKAFRWYFCGSYNNTLLGFLRNLSNF